MSTSSPMVLSSDEPPKRKRPKTNNVEPPPTPSTSAKNAVKKSSTLDAYTQTLNSDRTIKLVFGDSPMANVLHVSQNALEHTSTLFRSYFNSQPLALRARNILTLPEDDLPAWKVLLYWISKHELPPTEELIPTRDWHEQDGISDHSLCIRCWILGHKYSIPTFQDAIMLELLRSLDTQMIAFSAVKMAFEGTESGSVLRDLMIEEVAEALVDPDDKEMMALNMFDGIPCFISQLQMTQQRKGREGYDFYPRVPESTGCRQGTSPYQKFMVDGEGPRPYWLQRNLERAAREDARSWKREHASVG